MSNWTVSWTVSFYACDTWVDYHRGCDDFEALCAVYELFHGGKLLALITHGLVVHDHASIRFTNVEGAIAFFEGRDSTIREKLTAWVKRRELPRASPEPQRVLAGMSTLQAVNTFFADERAIADVKSGRRVAHLDEEALGRHVREVWIEWAKEQPDIEKHPNWLTPWDELSERDKDVDRRIGRSIAERVLEGDFRTTSSPSPTSSSFLCTLSHHAHARPTTPGEAPVLQFDSHGVPPSSQLPALDSDLE